MKYRNCTTGDVVDIDGLKEAVTNAYVPYDPTPQYLDDLGYDAVLPGDMPVTGLDQLAVPDGIEFNGLAWQVKWQVEALSPAELAVKLADAKTAKNAQINEWRIAANFTHFMHAGKVVRCDALSRSDIDVVAAGIAMEGTFPDEFPGAWKAADNSLIPLPNVAAFKAFHKSMTRQGSVNFSKSQQLKAALSAATTLAQVDAITWS